MKNFIILTEAIEYIEQNLTEPLKREDIAKHCYVSLSSLEKLFSYALHTSIKIYIDKRIMTKAAKDIICSENSITDIAMKYQYASAEVFTRSFKRVWNVNPSQFKDNWKFTGIFPKINYQYEKGDDLYMARKSVDISDAYDYLCSKEGSYVLCFDVKNLMEANKISRKAGDLMILNAASRIDKQATEEMLLLRIGGDEFALITGLTDIEKAQEIENRILAINGQPVIFDEHEIPLFLYCGTTKIPEHLRYSEFFSLLHETIVSSKKNS